MPGEQPIAATKQKLLNRSNRGDFSFRGGRLVLADGTICTGQVPDSQHGAFNGEVVFNTGMTGYVESLTDASYAGQILVFTYPLIGNYGVNTETAESRRVQVSGMVVGELAPHWSHDAADRSLLEWLAGQGVPVITGVDTRALTKHLRTAGTMGGTITDLAAKPKPVKLQTQFVSIDEPHIYNLARHKTVILVDCGAKENIVRSLAQFPYRIKRVPYDYDYTSENYDGVFISNGPGDPSDYRQTVAILRKALKIGKPVYGICLGNQLLALAAGAKTYKLPFGHRGHNQPCIETGTERAYITSQNHGYAIDGTTLPKGWQVSFKNLNDDSVEGIKHTSKPFASVQFHPEACPGPTDTAWFFERFIGEL